MDILLVLIPVALFLGLLGLAAFLWALRSGQFEDLDGAANRILFDDDDPRPSRADDDSRPSRADDDSRPSRADDDSRPSRADDDPRPPPGESPDKK